MAERNNKNKQIWMKFGTRRFLWRCENTVKF